MHCIDDKPNGICLNHDSAWKGDVRIAWYIAGASGPLPPSLHECWCSAPDLIAGRFSPTNGPPCAQTSSEPPVHVLTRAVALAVEDYLRFKMSRAVDNLSIRRDKL
jgi:hypothetical protein